MKIKINQAIKKRAGLRRGKSFWKKIAAMRHASTLRWTTYAGTGETLPPEYVTVILVLKGSSKSVRAFVAFDEITYGPSKPYWVIPSGKGENTRAVKGDRWR